MASLVVGCLDHLIVHWISYSATLMPRDGAIIFGDLTGKLDVLYVHCAKCTRSGRYQVKRLIEERGRNGKIIDWLDELTADCPKKIAHNMNDPCGARCPDLPCCRAFRAPHCYG